MISARPDIPDHDIMTTREQRLTENSRKRTRQNVSQNDSLGLPNEKQSVKSGKRKKADLLQQSNSEAKEIQDIAVEHASLIHEKHTIQEEQGCNLGLGFKGSAGEDMDKKQKAELRHMVHKVLLRDGAKVRANSLTDPTRHPTY